MHDLKLLNKLQVGSLPKTLRHFQTSLFLFAVHQYAELMWRDCKRYRLLYVWGLKIIQEPILIFLRKKNESTPLEHLTVSPFNVEKLQNYWLVMANLKISNIACLITSFKLEVFSKHCSCLHCIYIQANVFTDLKYD